MFYAACLSHLPGSACRICTCRQILANVHGAHMLHRDSEERASHPEVVEPRTLSVQNKTDCAETHTHTPSPPNRHANPFRTTGTLFLAKQVPSKHKHTTLTHNTCVYRYLYVMCKCMYMYICIICIIYIYIYDICLLYVYIYA